MRILFYLLAGYALVVGIAYMVQHKLLYFPDPTPPQAATMSVGEGMALAVWPAGGAAFRGYLGVGPAVAAPGRGTVVVFHGNAGSARDRVYYLAALAARGYRVILAEYPGYGGRDGEMGEASFARDGRETVRQAWQAFGGPLLVWGESLGAAVAAAVAADPALPVTGVALITPWDNLPALAQDLYWYLPARWLLRDRYDNAAHLRGYGGRVALLLAERDEIIPRRHGQRLYEAVPGPKRLWVFPGAGHNTWPIEPRAPWWDEVLGWLVPEAAAPDVGRRSGLADSRG